MTQAQLASEAGVGLRSVQRLEAGESAAHLSVFLRVCRVLGVIDRLDAFLPTPPVSPIAQLRLQRSQRKRATGTQPPPVTGTSWTWGEKG
jgi:transcriptional regulator with XRE-family HTH domain